MEIGGILMMILGAIIVIIFISNQVNQSKQQNHRIKSEEFDNKIKYQNFILAVKSIFPRANFSKIGYGMVDITTLKATLLNPNQRNIGMIEFSGSRDSWVTNAPAVFNIRITITINDKSFERKIKGIKDNVDILKNTIESLLTEIYSDSEYKKIVLATTY
jgi:hypothetical protein